MENRKKEPQHPKKETKERVPSLFIRWTHPKHIAVGLEIAIKIRAATRYKPIHESRYYPL